MVNILTSLGSTKYFKKENPPWTKTYLQNAVRSLYFE